MNSTTTRIGERIGPLLLEAQLDDDGQVYHALQVEQRRLFAVKLLPPQLVAGGPTTAEIASELQFLKSLEHPNLLRCFGGGLHDRQVYLVHELVQGDSLAAIMSRRGRLPWETVVEYAARVSAALEYADQRGALHQTLSPSKVLLGEDGQIKVFGFGRDRTATARRVELARQSFRHAAYLAPELVGGQISAGVKSDLYALGCMMYEMLTGELPFRAASTEEMLQQHLTAEPPRVSSLLFECPIWLDVLVHDMLAKDPAARPAYAGTVAVALEEVKSRTADRTGLVEQAVSHKPTVLKSQDAEANAKTLMKRKAAPRREAVPFYERVWFLAICCVLIAAVIAWGVWPLGEKQLLAKAEGLMATSDRANWHEARRRYLEPLLQRFPESESAGRAQEFLDQIDIADAEARIKLNSRLGREPASEGERLYTEAWKYEQFGDRVTALEKYRSLIGLLADQEQEQPFVKLAKRQVEQIVAQRDIPGDQAAFLEERLEYADRLQAEGKLLEAKRIWHGIVSLYAGNKELTSQVAQAQEKLSGKSEAAAPPEPDGG
jgi:serine/threonine protein kinase